MGLGIAVDHWAMLMYNRIDRYKQFNKISKPLVLWATLTSVLQIIITTENDSSEEHGVKDYTCKSVCTLSLFLVFLKLSISSSQFYLFTTIIIYKKDDYSLKNYITERITRKISIEMQ